MNRINLNDILALFERVGIKPVQGAWFGIKDNQPCGCLSVALLMDHPEGAQFLVDQLESKDRKLQSISVTEGLKYCYKFSEEYTKKLIQGWDSDPHFKYTMIENGFKDGRMAREIMIHDQSY